MEPVSGIGGFFFRARDPDALNRWYAKHLGVVPPTGRFRVRNLDRMIDQLRAAGVEVQPHDREYPNGRFAELADPEGNRLQLWEPNIASISRDPGQGRSSVAET